MANRHLARSVVLQTLFEWDSMQVPGADTAPILERNAKEFGGSDTDRPFMEQLLKGVLAKHTDIDHIITKARPTGHLSASHPLTVIFYA